VVESKLSLEGLEISIWYRLFPVASHKSHMPKPFIASSTAKYVKKICDFCCMLSGEMPECRINLKVK
jgi:hypothetical protein